MMTCHPDCHRRFRALTLAAVVAWTAVGGASISHGQSRYFDESSFVPPPPSNRISKTVGEPTPDVAVRPRHTASKAAPLDGTSLRGTSINRQPQISVGNTTSLAGQRSFFRPSNNPSRKPVAPAHQQRLNPSWNTQASPSTHVTSLGQIPINFGSISLASHSDDSSESAFGLSSPADGSSLPAPLSRHPSAIGGSMANLPRDRAVPPSITGSHLGLQPGETATERSLRLMTAIGGLEQQVEELGQQNGQLTEAVRQKDGQLLLAIRAIEAARNEVTSAAEELRRLQQQVKDLHERVRVAERDNAAVLETVAPLLQRLFESEASLSSPDAYTE